MKTFKDKVAVITGAASGIGRAIANRCAREGMRVVLADVEDSALAQAEAELKATGADVLAVLTDVSKAGDVEELAKKTLDAQKLEGQAAIKLIKAAPTVKISTDPHLGQNIDIVV